jgi:hypothetical protein
VSREGKERRKECFFPFYLAPFIDGEEVACEGEPHSEVVLLGSIPVSEYPRGAGVVELISCLHHEDVRYAGSAHRASDTYSFSGLFDRSEQHRLPFISVGQLSC